VRILVTGGAGYLGSVLVPMLLNDGHDVTVVDNFMYQQTSLLDCCWNSRLNVIRGDVRDRRLLEDVVPKADAIFPLACLTGAPICAREPETARAVNFEQIRAIAGLAGRGQQIVFPCTNSGYGIGEADIYCDEETPLRPISVYGRVKVEAETFLLDRGDCVTFRFATLFGISPRMRLDLLVNDFTFRARSLRGALRASLQAQLPPRTGRGAGVPARPRQLRRHERAPLQRRAQRRQPQQVGAL
jgi:nucleoside-diphosphate-sugar epimerase